MATQKKPAKAKTQVKVKDLKPKEDAKGGSKGLCGNELQHPKAGCEGRQAGVLWRQEPEIHRKQTQKITTTMDTQKKTTPEKKAKAQVKVKDLQPKKDAKGGFSITKSEADRE